MEVGRPVARPTLTDPRVRFFRTGLFRIIRFRAGQSRNRPSIEAPDCLWLCLLWPTGRFPGFNRVAACF